MNRIDGFKSLSNIFNQNGYKLFLVGGAVRDYLLHNDFSDMDVTSDATPEDIKKFISDGLDLTFEKFGSIKINYVGYIFELTTLRKESNYIDNRHPGKIEYTKSVIEDSKRRDFTINALYMDSDGKIYDYVDGEKDIHAKIIRMIGDSDARIKEDPLRIIRAIRFSLDLKFDFEPSLEKSLLDNSCLINSLNIQKVLSEVKKIKSSKEETMIKFKKFNISYLLDMIK